MSLAPDIVSVSTAQAPAMTYILLVDDVPQNLIALDALLAQDGVGILKAGSGAEALELLLRFDVALALLDVQMPEMDGFALAEFMRGSSRTRHVPIIFLTASPNDPARSFKGYDAGAVDFLHKPLDPRVLLGKVNVFIQLHRQRLELKERNERLERSLQLNETMIAVLTHDLRTPLSAISLCAERLVDEADGTPLARTASHVMSSAGRMTRMIEQLLDFSRIRSSILKLDFQKGDLGQVCEDVVAEMRHAHDGLPIGLSASGNLHGVFDGVRIAQAVSNLIGNAIQHGAAGDVAVHVDGTDKDRLEVCVRNAGQIPAHLLDRLFEPFKGSFHPSKGLGLGLYIADQFVRAHGGTLRAENLSSEVCFRLGLPRVGVAVQG